MRRTLTAALFQQYVEQGFVPCAECGEVRVDAAETINDAVETWNEHVQNVHGDDK
jgi:hypothetical protein